MKGILELFHGVLANISVYPFSSVVKKNSSETVF